MTQENNIAVFNITDKMPWGTHFCTFYKTVQDQLDILPSYFKKGLESNEYCMWVTCSPLDSKMAELALEKQAGDLSRYIKKGQLEILDYCQWYSKSGGFDVQKVLEGCIQKEKQALENGFEGLRVAGDTLWVESKDWKKIVEYESMVNDVIRKHKMIALCAYNIGKCDSSDVLDVASNHQFSLIRHGAEWVVIENARHKQLEREMRKQTEDASKALEERLSQTRKIKALELTAASLANDFNNTLVLKDFTTLAGGSPFIQEVRKKIAAIARLEIPVLIQGASGTGKEVVAHCIHQFSLRAAKPFVVVNCTSLAPSLIESELFGHIQGAFTGAMKSKIGLFESAGGGSLFLDEIGDLALSSQVKFLQVLDKGEFMRVGGTSTRKADVRLICATNQDLEKMVADGRFRKDLYYRICGTQINLVPLRERKEDIPFLVRHFLGEKAALILPEVMEILQQQDWPGNVRELKMVSETLKGYRAKKVIDKEAVYKILEAHSTQIGRAHV
jgi:transcriptional regulator with PAS, ATPase and Fis domain